MLNGNPSDCCCRVVSKVSGEMMRWDMLNVFQRRQKNSERYSAASWRRMSNRRSAVSCFYRLLEFNNRATICCNCSWFWPSKQRTAVAWHLQSEFVEEQPIRPITYDDGFHLGLCLLGLLCYVWLLLSTIFQRVHLMRLFYLLCTWVKFQLNSVFQFPISPPSGVRRRWGLDKTYPDPSVPAVVHRFSHVVCNSICVYPYYFSLSNINRLYIFFGLVKIS